MIYLVYLSDLDHDLSDRSVRREPPWEPRTGGHSRQNPRYARYHYVTHPWGGFPSPIAPQPGGCQYRTMRLRKVLGEMVPTPRPCCHRHSSNCGGIDHRKSPPWGVTCTVVHGTHDRPKTHVYPYFFARYLGLICVASLRNSTERWITRGEVSAPGSPVGQVSYKQQACLFRALYQSLPAPPRAVSAWYSPRWRTRSIKRKLRCFYQTWTPQPKRIIWTKRLIRCSSRTNRLFSNRFPISLILFSVIMRWHHLLLNNTPTRQHTSVSKTLDTLT